MLVELEEYQDIIFMLQSLFFTMQVAYFGPTSKVVAYFVAFTAHFTTTLQTISVSIANNM